MAFFSVKKMKKYFLKTQKSTLFLKIFVSVFPVHDVIFFFRSVSPLFAAESLPHDSLCWSLPQDSRAGVSLTAATRWRHLLQALFCRLPGVFPKAPYAHGLPLGGPWECLPQPTSQGGLRLFFAAGGYQATISTSERGGGPPSVVPQRPRRLLLAHLPKARARRCWDWNPCWNWSLC